MKAHSEFQERRDAAGDRNLTLAGLGRARDELEQRALPGAVAADDSHRLARRDREADVAQHPVQVVARPAGHEPFRQGGPSATDRTGTPCPDRRRAIGLSRYPLLVLCRSVFGIVAERQPDLDRARLGETAVARLRSGNAPFSGESLAHLRPIADHSTLAACRTYGTSAAPAGQRSIFPDFSLHGPAM